MMNRAIAAFAVEDTNIFAGTYGGGLYCASINDDIWHQSYEGLSSLTPVLVSSIAGTGTDLYVGTLSLGIFRALNNSNAWTSINNGITDDGIIALAAHAPDVVAGSYGKLFHSSNRGSNWTETVLPGRVVSALAFHDSTCFAGMDNGIYRSIDNGASWTASNLNGVSASIKDFKITGSMLYANSSIGVLRSTDDGMNWSQVTGMPEADMSLLAVNGLRLIAESYGGLYRSTDSGANWTKLILDAKLGIPYEVIFSGNNLFACRERRVYVSTDLGTKWTPVDNGVMAHAGNLIIRGTTLIACGVGIWQRPLSEMVTSIGVHSIDSPQKLYLNQNYPNPVNPSTTISFNLPSKEYVSLKIFDVMGKEISTLVSKELSAGIHLYQWNPGELSSGVYFYRIQAGSFTETKHLLLLK
jgi:photosystem II stability/assembly factor-like uncharacterized protein